MIAEHYGRFVGMAVSEPQNRKSQPNPPRVQCLFEAMKRYQATAASSAVKAKLMAWVTKYYPK
jgi:hypothetical protein